MSWKNYCKPTKIPVAPYRTSLGRVQTFQTPPLSAERLAQYYLLLLGQLVIDFQNKVRFHFVLPRYSFLRQNLDVTCDEVI